MGGSWWPSAAQAATTFGFHLVNKHWLWDWTLVFLLGRGRRMGVQPMPRFCPSCPAPPSLWPGHRSHTFSPADQLPFAPSVVDCLLNTLLTWPCVPPCAITGDSELARQRHSPTAQFPLSPQATKAPSFLPAPSGSPLGEGPAGADERRRGEQIGEELRQGRQWGWEPWATRVESGPSCRGPWTQQGLGPCLVAR